MRAYRKEHRDEIKKYEQEHNEERKLVYKKSYYLHREKRIESAKKRGLEYRPLHKKEAYEYHKKYVKKYKDKYGIGISTITRYGLKLALEIYEKFNRKCSQCGGENNLVIHHLDRKGLNYERLGLNPNNDPKNLVILCNRCHSSIHGKQGKGVKHGPFTEEHKRRISEGKKRAFKMKLLTESK
jgi:hypothetical protein